MFVPKYLQTWKPEHMRQVPMRRCHWCTGEPKRLSDLVHILEAPMRYHFCSEQCVDTWAAHRHDQEVVNWLKEGAGVRAKILKRSRDETCPKTESDS